MRFGQPGGRDVGSGEHASLSPAALRWSKEVKALEAAQKASSEKSSEYNRRAARGRRLFEDVQIGRGKHREGDDFGGTGDPRKTARASRWDASWGPRQAGARFGRGILVITQM